MASFQSSYYLKVQNGIMDYWLSYFRTKNILDSSVSTFTDNFVPNKDETCYGGRNIKELELYPLKSFHF